MALEVTNYLVASQGLDPQDFTGDFPEATAAEVGNDVAEALAITVTTANTADWTYSGTAEDNGTAGSLDGQPGVIYNGPAGQTVGVRVRFSNLDVAEGAITVPEAGDRFYAGVWVNSTLVAISDEGVFTELDTETAVECNLDTVIEVKGGDVVRIGVAGSAGTETSDLDIAEGGAVLLT